MRKIRRNRKGASAVEAGLMLPVLVVITFGAIDIAQFINSGQVISNTCREGARVASRNSTETVQEVEDRVLEYIGGAIPQLTEEERASAVTIQVRQVAETTVTGEDGEEVTTRTYTQIPNGDLTSVESGDAISVIVQFDYSSIRWIRWLSGPGFSQHEVETICRRY